MTEKEKILAKEWVENWKRVGPILEELQGTELKKLSISEEILALSDASESAIRMYPPQPTSGMIEMQRYFMKFKR